MPCLLLLAMLLTPGFAAGAEVADRVVVVVGDELVLESEVQLEAELATLDRSPVPFWDPAHDTPLHRLVDAAVVRASAGELELYEPPADEVRERLELTRHRFPDRVSWEAFLSRWGLDEVTLSAQLRRRMVVERFLLRNLQVSPAEHDLWMSATEELLDQLRPRYAMREIVQRSGGGSETPEPDAMPSVPPADPGVPPPEPPQ